MNGNIYGSWLRVKGSRLMVQGSGGRSKDLKILRETDRKRLTGFMISMSICVDSLYNRVNSEMINGGRRL